MTVQGYQQVELKNVFLKLCLPKMTVKCVKST
jgi:hypothetical protein